MRPAMCGCNAAVGCSFCVQESNRAPRVDKKKRALAKKRRRCAKSGGRINAVMVHKAKENIFSHLKEMTPSVPTGVLKLRAAFQEYLLRSKVKGVRSYQRMIALALEEMCATNEQESNRPVSVQMDGISKDSDMEIEVGMVANARWKNQSYESWAVEEEYRSSGALELAAGISRISIATD